jgi:hypothetical protein
MAAVDDVVATAAVDDVVLLVADDRLVSIGAGDVLDVAQRSGATFGGRAPGRG